jgi:DNA polymerase-3 subunit alpha
MLRKAQDLIAARGVTVDLAAIALDDKKTYEMLGRGETVGVFQVESGGMRRALVDMRADRFEDLIALVALYRPGPMANIPTYCARKLGEEEIDVIHPKIEPALRETFGVIIYQEQVMEIARTLSGYSLGEADMLRRAMGKKIKAEMDAQRARFVNGAKANGLTAEKAEEIFELLAKFADYGFNKSHAAAYALISYWTAWFKANHPAEFLAASMTLEKSNTDKLSELRAEAARMGVAVLPPSVNLSAVDFEVLHEGRDAPAIAYAIGAVKGVGEGQAEAIVLARGDKPFASMSDFASRIDARALNKKALENFAAAGGFDALDPDRASAVASVEQLLALASRNANERAAGQNSMFAGEPDSVALKGAAPSWSTTERLKREFEAIGFFLSGHPLDGFGAALKRVGARRWVDFARAVREGESAGKVGAVVLDRFERRTKSGSKIGVFQLSDPSGQFEAIIFQEGLAKYRDDLEKGAEVLLTLQAAVEGEDIRSRILAVEPLLAAAAKATKGLRVFVRDATPLISIGERLTQKGENEVALVAMLGPGRGEVEIKLPGRYAVPPAIAAAIKAAPGVVAVEPY